jgi:ABC-type transporter Mla MlaB component
MATQDDNSGLLSKVAKFVRNPTTDWGGLEKVEAPESGENSKLALKRMIERKAHNDAVRKREFSQLRKIRQASRGNVAGLVQRPSSFRDSSGFSDHDERAQTLKKIDEIEAQMSKQWWKARPGATPDVAIDRQAAPQSPGKPVVAGTNSEKDSAFASTLQSNLSDSMADVPTQMGAAPENNLMSFDPGADATATPTRSFELTGTSAFSASNMVSVDMGQNLSDPVLEEAAIRFANSDDAGAESVLLVALQAPDADPELTDTWAAALFDMYRSTGQQASFDRVALDYALRFGRSAPGWFSTPAAISLSPAPQGATSQARPSAVGPTHWDCPEVLDVPSVEQLEAMVVLGGGPFSLDWHSLKSIVPAAGQRLAGCFARWCEQTLTLHLDGVETLDHVLRVYTPVSDNQVEVFWWQLRLDAMRILRMQDEFDLAAMDYCVTYEVSPPPWEPARCQRTYGQHVDTQVMDFGDDFGLNQSPLVQVKSHPVPAANGSADNRRPELCGDVLGDATDVLAPLRSAVQEGGVLMVNCANLIRVDFSAAGSILNWAATAQASGIQVELHDLPRLVAAFFNLIGINEHARVTARTN